MGADRMIAEAEFVDLGGTGVLAHLAPANGFPPQVYGPLVEPLQDLLHVIALVPLAMRASFPPPKGLTWHLLAEEMMTHLDSRGLRGLVGLGHSLGAVMTLLAAARRPDMFRVLVLMDPVIFHPRWLLAMRVMRWLGLGDRYPLVQAARRRRRVFPSRQDADARYRKHPFFANWHPDAFAAYIRYGLRERGDGAVELAYSPDWEAAIFGSVPTDIWRWIPRVRLPTLVLYGARSDTFRPDAARRLQALWPHAEFVALADAGHMFPLEQPETAAAVVRDFLIRHVKP